MVMKVRSFLIELFWEVTVSAVCPLFGPTAAVAVWIALLSSGGPYYGWAAISAIIALALGAVYIRFRDKVPDPIL